jgi:fermentation-respiration switch protein FrsA (DUF1100 family)
LHLNFTRLSVFVLAVLSSCSLNKIFLHPYKLSSESKELSIKTKMDTMFVSFEENYQPIFLTPSKDTIHQNFTIKSVVFENSNGTKLNGWFLESKTIPSVATIVHFHGNAGSLFYQHQAISPLIEEGFRIFMFDYSGFGFSEGKATRKNVLKDAHAAIDFIKMKFGNDEKIVVYGQSLGGHLAGVVGTQRQTEIDALVIEGAFSSHKDIAREFAGGFGKMMTKELYSAIEFIPNFKKPILIIHSTEDETIPFTLGQKIFECATEPKFFYEVKECHICAPRYYVKEIGSKIRAMLK